MLVYDSHDVKFYHGDCAKIAPQLPPVDLIVTSPPYGGLRSFGGHKWDFYSAAPAIAGVLAPGGVLCWQTNDQIQDGGYSGESFETALWFMKQAGLRLHDRIVADTNRISSAGNRWVQTWDFVWVLSKGSPKTFNPIMDKPNVSAGATDYKTTGARTREGDIPIVRSKPNGYRIRPYGKRTAYWYYGISGEERRLYADLHPSLMAMPLAQDLIRAYSDAGDIVLDPFSGSGTTARAAQVLGRRAIGIEIHKPYIDAGIQARFRQGILL